MAMFNDRRPGAGLHDVSDFTKMTKDKTLSRKRMVDRIRAKPSESVTAPVAAANETSQRVKDAWKAKQRRSA